MKRCAKVFVSAAILGALLTAPGVSIAESLGALRVRLVQGDVQVRITDTGEWVPASANMPLVEGDEMWVPDGGRAALQTNNGAHVRLDEYTALQVLRTDRDAFQFHLAQGHAYVLSRLPGRSALQFDTPEASIRAFGNATFRIDIADGETAVSVLKGSVLAENAAGTTKVPAGDMLALGPDGYAELSPLPPPDDWERWNAERDRIALARREGQRHLPDELRVYAGDFDDNGRWVYVEDYGYCWTPTVVVINDWAPYRHGRWVWRGGDYVWIGYEPWGWAPYHYGRWAFSPRFGWCWVPPRRGDVYWAPGYVGWVRTGDHVAWVPLAPRETYYGYGNYGRHSVNVRTVDVSRVRVTNVYRNVYVTNSVTVVNHTTFVTGRPAPVHRDVVVKVRENFAQRRDIVPGRPAIKPAETSYHPVVRSIPDSRRPPNTVRKIDVKELRQSRPLVRDPGRSAIRPQAQPRPLEVRKVDKPRSVDERVRERSQGRPAEKRGPAAPKESPAPKVERGGRPEAPVPAGRTERESAPVQKAPRERGRRETPTATPPVRYERREIRPQPPAEKAAPEARPERPLVRPEAPAKPDRSIERGRPPAAPAETVTPASPPSGRERGKDVRRGEERGKRERAAPEAKEKKAGTSDNAAEKRDDRGRPERPSRQEGQGIRR